MADIRDATKGAVIVARHGERIDYVLRDTLNKNWVATASRPWDPPLTSRGRVQGRLLGKYLSKLLKEKGLGPVTAVYSSPMVRCCQTAAEAIIGLQDEEGGSESLKVKVEPGLVESMNEKWYRAWCLHDSDGTWGGPKRAADAKEDEDESNIDPRAMLPAHSLVLGPNEIADFLKDEESSSQLEDSDDNHRSPPFVKNDNLAALIDVESTEAEHVYPIQQQVYKYNVFESRGDQKDRMGKVVQHLSNKYPNQTVMLLSHGGPVTNLYERLTENDRSEFGFSKYTSFSVYIPNRDGGNVWETVVSNESCHVDDINCVDITSSHV